MYWRQFPFHSLLPDHLLFWEWVWLWWCNVSRYTCHKMCYNWSAHNNLISDEGPGTRNRLYKCHFNTTLHNKTGSNSAIWMDEITFLRQLFESAMETENEWTEKDWKTRIIPDIYYEYRNMYTPWSQILSAEWSLGGAAGSPFPGHVASWSEQLTNCFVIDQY